MVCLSLHALYVDGAARSAGRVRRAFFARGRAVEASLRERANEARRRGCGCDVARPSRGSRCRSWCTNPSRITCGGARTSSATRGVPSSTAAARGSATGSSGDSTAAGAIAPRPWASSGATTSTGTAGTARGRRRTWARACQALRRRREVRRRDPRATPRAAGAFAPRPRAPSRAATSTATPGARRRPWASAAPSGSRAASPYEPRTATRSSGP